MKFQWPCALPYHYPLNINWPSFFSPSRQKIIQIATGSKYSNYLIKTAHLSSLFSPFGSNLICGDDPILLGKGKPDPTIFIEAAKILGRGSEEKRREILVFEDGVPGVRAARAAGMEGTSRRGWALVLSVCSSVLRHLSYGYHLLHLISRLGTRCWITQSDDKRWTVRFHEFTNSHDFTRLRTGTMGITALRWIVEDVIFVFLFFWIDCWLDVCAVCW